MYVCAANHIGDSGAKCIADALLRTESLTELNLFGSYERLLVGVSSLISCGYNMRRVWTESGTLDFNYYFEIFNFANACARARDPGPGLRFLASLQLFTALNGLRSTGVQV